MLLFCERLTMVPEDVGPADVGRACAAGVSHDALADAVEVCAAFNTIDRIADALDFAPQSERSLAASTEQLTTRGYV